MHNCLVQFCKGSGLDEAYIEQMMQFCFSAAVSYQRKDHSKRNESLWREMSNVANGIGKTFTNTEHMEAVTFAQRTSAGDNLDFQLMLPLFNPDRHRGFLERIFTPNDFKILLEECREERQKANRATPKEKQKKAIRKSSDLEIDAVLPDTATVVKSVLCQRSPRADSHLPAQIQTSLNVLSTEVAELKVQVIELHGKTDILHDRLSRIEFCATSGGTGNGRVQCVDRLDRLEEQVRILSGLLPASATAQMGKPGSAAVEMQSSHAQRTHNDQLLALLRSQIQALSEKTEKLDNAVNHLSKKAAKEENTAKYRNAEALRKADEAQSRGAVTRSSLGAGDPLPTLLGGGESSASHTHRRPAQVNVISSYDSPGHILGSQQVWHPQYAIWQPQPVLCPGLPSPLAAAGRFSFPRP
eukprot:TRINITY_DN74206_c0_g1_i1.p1 TRINITY_DN74206_c0_g1~~TRINITY_DN74206_c0_g1_i1.p1  ORF type:complete len:413 (+),score=64.27 TRINITY_DN74206_c0_g1_i1:1212-2450(+)